MQAGYVQTPAVIRVMIAVDVRYGAAGFAIRANITAETCASFTWWRI
ncbi:MAG: hypothetical protein LBV17_09855 [Treponema sp.]|jgi:hypothetical protein|nr:hypothetical protein [Treponema sp.]